jgi:hypothetical protein
LYTLQKKTTYKPLPNLYTVNRTYILNRRQLKYSTYVLVMPIMIQSLNEHGDTEEDGMQKAEDRGGGVLS